MKNQTNVDPYVKWNNTVIRIENEFHGAKVIEFWESVGVNTFGWKDNAMDIPYYGICNGIFDNYIDSSDCRVLTLEEAITIRDSETKTFPREMYVWDNDIRSIEKQMVYLIIDKSVVTDERVIVVEDKQTFAFKNAMEVEEYEAMMKKENENAELIKQIEKTEK